MPSRDAALAALYDRLAGARDNPGLLIADDALGDAAELAATTDTTTDPSAAQALGWFHWNRHLSLPDSDGAGDLAAATSYFASVYQASPASVPAPIRQALRDREQDSAVPGDDPDAANDQGISLFSAYQSNGEFPALVEAIALFRKAAAAAPNDRAAYLANLGAALQLLFGRTGELGTLTEAIEVTREAVAAAPSGDPDLARYLGNLVGALQLLFGHTGDPGALAEAIRAGRDAVAATQAGDPYRAMCLGNLGVALWTLFERTGDLGALSEAAGVTREAVAAAPADDTNRAVYLKSLATVLNAQFERAGDLGALAEAVQAGRDAVAAIPVGDPGRAGYLNNLGGALQLLFGHTGDLSALTEAIVVTRQAVAAARSGDPDRAAYLSNLGATLQRLFGRTGELNALAEAVQAGRDAVAAARSGDPARAGYQSNLGLALQKLFRHTGDLSTLTEAIEVTRQAVAALPVGDPARATYQGNLGATLQRLFEHTGEIRTLTEAIQLTREALAASPSGHPNRAVHLSELGNALQTLAEHTGDTEALTEAAKCFQAVGDSTAAAVPLRISGWRRAAVILTDRVGEEALAAAESAVALLPQLTPRSLARADREHQLSEVGSLAGVAAAAAIAAGRPERAVELLEQTRGVLAADTIDARSSDLTRLRETTPELAEAFEELRARMQALDQLGAAQPGYQATRSQDLEQARREAPDLAEARREAQSDWDQLINRIRSVDGFASFLAAPSISKLADQAHDGPIVFVSASPTRCDALTLTDDPHTPVRLVPLAPLTLTDAAVRAAMVLVLSRAAIDPSEKPASRMAAQTKVLEVLAWIWDTITEPVLTALGHTTAPSREEPWPRVWWSAVGALAHLPLHAAGHHSDLTAGDPALAANPRTVLNRVVSSYTTTVRSLAYARTHHLGTGNGKAVVIAVPDAPGTHPLPGVTAEATALTKLLPDALVLADPTRDTVLATLPGHQVAHFSCHGYADRDDPASSRLILRDHQTAPLTVADVSALHLTGGLAYLSACDTTVTSPKLADEAVHITGAFHLAGYQHVIGTLWPINDALARDIAEDFYADLTAGGTTPPQTDRSARALHHAIRRLRARYPQTPTLWAAHTHTGL